MSTMALLLTLALIPLLFGPDSPRFKLVILRKNEKKPSQDYACSFIVTEKFSMISSLDFVVVVVES